MKRVCLNLLNKSNRNLLKESMSVNNTDTFVSMFLDKLFSNTVTVYEEIEGSKIFVNWDGKNISIKNKTMKNDPLNFIDLSLQKYYSAAFSFFFNLDPSTLNLLDKRAWYCFEYFPDEQPSNVKYNRLPKNQLVLTSIYRGKKYDYNYQELTEYANNLNCDVTPIIFQGQLNEQQISLIKYFLNVSKEDLPFVFGEQSFAFFFYKLLNPNLTNSFLMDENSYQDNVKKLIIKLSDDDEYIFEILNPVYEKLNMQNDTNFMDMYSLILLNAVNYIESLDYNQFDLDGDYFDIVYCNLMCQIFNDYIVNIEQDLLRYDFTIPKFFQEEKFSVNSNLIQNKTTKEYLLSDKRLEYVFKVLLGSYLYEKKKPIGFFSLETMEIYNRQVKNIKKTIDNYLNKETETELMKNKLMDFEQFFKLNYEKDAAGDIYPSVEDELVIQQDNSKKKDKMDLSDLDFSKFQKK